MDRSNGKETWMWVSGLENTYDRAIRAHVLKGYLKEKSKHRKEKPKTQDVRRTGTELLWRPQLQDSGPSEGARTANDTLEGTTREMIRLSMSPDIRSPSHNMIFFDIALQNFIRHALIPSQRGNSFIGGLTFIESRKPELRILYRAARASSTVFHGYLTGDLVFAMEGQRWGLLALRGVNEELRLVQNPRQASLLDGKTLSHAVPSVDLVSGSILLAFHECATGTSPSAWLHHLLGAEALLVMLGPERCQTGYEFDLFRTIRYAAIQSSIISRKPSTLGREPWITTPYANTPKDHVDTLVDILLTLPVYMQLTEQTCSNRHRLFDSAAKSLAVKHVVGLKARLERWWERFNRDTFADLDLSEVFPNTSRIAENHAISSIAVSIHRRLAHDFIVELKSKWDMGMLLALSMLASLEINSQQRYQFTTQCNVCAASILACDDWVEVQDAQGNKSGLWHILLPLAVVSMVCPDANLRHRADRKLEKYGREKAVGGVSTLNKLNTENIFGVNWGIGDFVAQE